VWKAGYCICVHLPEFPDYDEEWHHSKTPVYPRSLLTDRWVVAGQIIIGNKDLPFALMHSMAVTIVRLTPAPHRAHRDTHREGCSRSYPLSSILASAPLSQIQQMISGTSSALFDSIGDEMRESALDAIVQALQKVCGPKSSKSGYMWIGQFLVLQIP
jgi:hypothetical protein